MTDFPLSEEILRVAISVYEDTKRHTLSFYGLIVCIRLAVEAIKFGTVKDYLGIIRDIFVTSFLLRAFIPLIKVIVMIPQGIGRYLESTDPGEILINNDSVIMDAIITITNKVSVLSYSISYFMYCCFISLLVMAGAYIIFFSVMLKNNRFLNIFFTTILIVSFWPFIWYLFNFIVVSFATKDNSLVNSMMVICAEVLKALAPLVATVYFFIRPISKPILTGIDSLKNSGFKLKNTMGSLYQAPMKLASSVGFKEQVDGFNRSQRSIAYGLKNKAQSIAPSIASKGGQGLTKIWDKTLDLGVNRRLLPEGMKQSKSIAQKSFVNENFKTPENELILKKESISVPNNSEIYGKNAGTESSKLTEIQLKKPKDFDASKPLNTDVFKDFLPNKDLIITSAKKPKILSSKRMNYTAIPLNHEKYGPNKWYYPGLDAGVVSSSKESVTNSYPTQQDINLSPRRVNNTSHINAWGTDISLKRSTTEVPNNREYYGDMAGKSLSQIVSIDYTEPQRPNIDNPFNTTVFKNYKIDESFVFFSKQKPKVIFTEKMNFAPIRLNKARFGGNKWYYPGLFSNDQKKDEGETC